MKTFVLIDIVIALLFVCCYAFQLLYLIIPYVRKASPHGKTKIHKYAIVICARNERNVISDLIESVKKQDYPSEMVKIFVDIKRFL